MWNNFEALKDSLIRQYAGNNWEIDGLDEKELEKGIDEIYKKGYSPVRAKAESIAFILRNGKLEINPNEFFQDKVCNGDVLPRKVRGIARVMSESDAKDATDKARALTECNGIAATMDFGHLGPDWRFLMKNGLVGAIDRAKASKEKHLDDAEKCDFYDSVILVYDALCDCLLRMAEIAKKYNTEKMQFVANNLKSLAVSAPKTLAQAMQLTIFYYKMQSAIEGSNIRSLGGIDSMYYPFYKNDLQSGAFTEAQLRELTCYFLIKINAMHIIANLPFYICGKQDGKDATNEYTFLLLEEYRRLDIYDPKMHVMYHKDINPKILEMLLEMIREGKNSFVFINTEVASKALENIGIETKDAEKVIVYGCYETAAEGTEIPCTCGGMMNLCKAVELALNGGVDPLSNKFTGLETPIEFADFNAFYEATMAQLKFMTETCMDTMAEYEKYYNKVYLAPMLSGTFSSSMEKGIDVYSGGAKYNNTSVVGAGMATLVDSLIAVKHLVFEDKRCSLEELKSILKNNWKDHEKLRLFVLNNYAKYGNNQKEADDIATDIFERFSALINGRKNGRGGVFRCGMFSVDWRDWMGETMGATPDGRLEGEPFSKNLCANVGQDKAGVTAFINTVLKFDGEKMPDGSVTDILLHTSAVKGEGGMAAFLGLLKAFMSGGGFAVHFNIMNAETLKKAQKEPDKYKNLQVRLCGWNVHFVRLSKKEQDEFIVQADR